MQEVEYYLEKNIPCDCRQYTIIFSRGTLNCMDVLYCPIPICYNAYADADEHILNNNIVSKRTQNFGILN